jgi:predicted amidohydrolase YtcJ
VTVAAGPAEPEAVAVKDGIIVFTGGYDDALSRWRGPRAQLRDLRGQALLPGFIDAHGHLGGIGLQATIASLLAEPDGDVSDIAALQDALRAFAASEVGSSSAWIVGFGTTTPCSPSGATPTHGIWMRCRPPGRYWPSTSPSTWAR